MENTSALAPVMDTFPSKLRPSDLVLVLEIVTVRSVDDPTSRMPKMMSDEGETEMRASAPLFSHNERLLSL